MKHLSDKRVQVSSIFISSTSFDTEVEVVKMDRNKKKKYAVVLATTTTTAFLLL